MGKDPESESPVLLTSLLLFVVETDETVDDLLLLPCPRPLRLRAGDLLLLPGVPGTLSTDRCVYTST